MARGYAAGLFLSILSVLADANDKKNVLIFFIDDLRPELGCYDVDYIKSPSIDKLASQGVQFDRAYCQQAICAPSRISMMSGQYPDKTGIYDLFTPVRRKHPDIMTLPRYFKEQGYTTASFGKVYHHQTDDRQYWAELPEQPSDKYANPETLKAIQHLAEEANRKGLKGTELSAASKGPAVEIADVTDEGYRDGAVAKQAIESLRRNKEKPFFVCVGFAKPHLPFAAREQGHLVVRSRLTEGVFDVVVPVGVDDTDTTAALAVPFVAAAEGTATQSANYLRAALACAAHINANLGINS